LIEALTNTKVYENVFYLNFRLKGSVMSKYSTSLSSWDMQMPKFSNVLNALHQIVTKHLEVAN